MMRGDVTAQAAPIITATLFVQIDTVGKLYIFYLSYQVFR
jgi:hypothetical protein